MSASEVVILTGFVCDHASKRLKLGVEFLLLFSDMHFDVWKSSMNVVH